MTSSARFTIARHATDELEARLAQFEKDRSLGPVKLTDYAPGNDDESYGAMITELARIDLEYAFNAGDLLDASRYLEAYPAVFAIQHNRSLLAFEEYRLRSRGGQDVTAEEIAGKYDVDAGQWHPVVPKPRQIESNTNPAFPQVHYPNVGDAIAGYPLIQRLGEGALSRVFVAQQPDLVSRLVVLKVTPFSTQESDQLAQLQHSNIIPIYSMHRERDLACICMPFLGSTTLADLSTSGETWTSLAGPAQKLVSTIVDRRRSTIRSLPERSRNQRSKSSHADATNQPGSQVSNAFQDLNQEQQDFLSLSKLGQLGYVDAFLKLFVDAVEGLSHAHERGIVHRDLKPANILVTDDGRAVLLDFNLAVSNKDQATRLVGGTLPYMSPQQLNAIELSGPADPRDDVFSMGVIVYELLSGKLPFESPRANESVDLSSLIGSRCQRPASLRSSNEQISWGLESIVFRCLAAERENRYQNAGELLDDLNLHRQHLPLRHAPNVSRHERLAKWFARHPRLTSASTVGSFAMLALVLSAMLLWKRADQIQRLGAEAKLQQFDSLVPEAIVSLSTPGREPELLQLGIDRSSQLMKQWNTGASPLKRSAEFEQLEVSPQRYLAGELAQLAYLMSAAEADLALQTTLIEHEKHSAAALRWNHFAVELDAKIGPLADYQRHRIEIRLKQIDDQSQPPFASSEVELPELQTLVAAESGDAKALREISISQLQRHPTDVTAWFNLSIAQWRSGAVDDAVAGLNVCDRMGPNWLVIIFNRGLCNLERGKSQQAVDDFSQCLRIDPQSLTARFNRAVGYRQLGQLTSSLNDLDIIVASRKPTTRMLLMRGQVHDALGNRQQAALDRVAALQVEPQDANDWVARGVSRLREFPEKALDDFAAARRINPHHYSALQNSAHVLSERLDRPGEAVEILSQMIAVRTSDASPVASRGILLARTGDVEAAEQDAKEAESRSPGALEQLQLSGIYALILRHSDGNADASDVKARKKSLTWLARAIRSNPKLATVAATDDDLASLRNDDEFRRLISSGRLIDSTSG